MRRVLAFAAASALALACSESAIVIGDDTDPNADPGEPDPLVDPDAAPFEASTEDATPIKVPPADGGDAAADAEPDVSCPVLSPPAPGFCDGATPVAMYSANGCISGYGCAPLDCTTAGGQCVGLSPTSCPAPKQLGDATKYSCGGGVGVGCCLP